MCRVIERNVCMHGRSAGANERERARGATGLLMDGRTYVLLPQLSGDEYVHITSWEPLYNKW
jgi:hypothetical protein